MPHLSRQITADYIRYAFTLIDFNNEIIFFTSRKCACTAVNNIFHKATGINIPKPISVHSQAWRDKFSYLNTLSPYIDYWDFKRVQFLRNPFDRVVSMYYYLQTEDRIHPMAEGPGVACSWHTNSIYEFLEGIQNGDIRNCDFCAGHAHKQIIPIRIDEFIDIDHMESGLRRLNEKYGLALQNVIVDEHGIRKTGIDYKETLKDRTLLNMIEETYPEDIELFNRVFKYK